MINDHHRSHLNLIAVAKPNTSCYCAIRDGCSILATQILQRGLTMRNHNPSMTTRDTGDIEHNRGRRIPSNQVVAFR